MDHRDPPSTAARIRWGVFALAALCGIAFGASFLSLDATAFEGEWASRVVAASVWAVLVVLPLILVASGVAFHWRRRHEEGWTLMLSAVVVPLIGGAGCFGGAVLLNLLT